jgi:hypothetical protein
MGGLTHRFSDKIRYAFASPRAQDRARRLVSSCLQDGKIGDGPNGDRTSIAL